MENYEKISFYFSKVNLGVSIIEGITLTTFAFFAVVLQIGWAIHVMNMIKIAYNTRRRMKCSDSIGSCSHVELVNCENKITQGKYLIAMLSLEFLSFASFWIAFGYPALHFVIPGISKTSLIYNNTCISKVEGDKIWISEFRYIPTAVFMSLGRSNIILTIGVAMNFFRFIHNTYVGEAWRKKTFRPIKYSVVVSFVIFILGCVPQLIILALAVFLIVYFIYLLQLVRYGKLLNKAMRWRQDDLYHENEVQLLKLHNKQNKHFSLTMKCIGIALLLIFLTQTIVFLEMVLSLLLYYGKCIFPNLYGFHYPGLLTDEQLPIFKIFLLTSSIVQKLMITLCSWIYSLPYIIITSMLILKNLNLRKQTVYRYSLKEHLLYSHARS